MNAVWKIYLSLSCSGGLLILALLLGKRFLKNRLSRQWQYYIWLAVVLRLLLPFGPEAGLLGKAYLAVDTAVTRAAPAPPGAGVPAAGPGQEEGSPPAEGPASLRPPEEAGAPAAEYAWILWLGGALGLLIRRVTIYQSFLRYLRAGSTPAADVERLDRLAAAARQAGVQRPVELWVNPLVSSPLLIGFCRPCIVLPGADLSEEDFRHIVLHELTHYRRRDALYKWLVQLAVCLHWFNPLVHLMAREITRACEFSCDEAVLAKLGDGGAGEYGKTLLDAMAAVGRYRENPGAVTFGENKRLLKERLDAIMNYGKKPAARLLTGALTLCILFGAACLGVYPAAAAEPAPEGPRAGQGTGAAAVDYAARAEESYRAESLPLFEMTFPRLDGDTQKRWLERFYKEGDIAFFSAALRGLDTASELAAGFAERAYAEEEAAFFSALMDRMDRGELEGWLDRALADGNWAFQSMLFDRLDKGDEWNEEKAQQEKEWAAAREAEYRAVGVTVDGRDYFYQGQRVNILLDIRASGSFYTLNMNPAGTVNVRILRDAGDNVAGAALMTEAEAAELLGEMGDDGGREAPGAAR